MQYYKKLYLIIVILSSLSGGTPFEYTLGLTGGYDGNVMRFSKDEFNDAAQVIEIMGGSSTFDSFVTRLSFSGKKSFIFFGDKGLNFRLFYSTSNYTNTPEKKYWSGGLDVSYKWGSYKNIKYSLRHLDHFYLRHYIDRDISTGELSPCFFTDRNQSILLSQRVSIQSWFNIGVGYLQRYYSRPFIEFDLDIYYLKGKFNHKIKRYGTIALQVKRGRAVGESHFLPEMPSSFDRSYETIEWFAPLKMNKKIHFLDEIGISARLEHRVYDAEDPNDPLHAGRSHLDSKYDFWFAKRVNENMKITVSTRYRTRSTDSKYDWVKDLKSFNQMQCWFKIEWNMIYDNY